MPKGSMALLFTTVDAVPSWPLIRNVLPFKRCVNTGVSDTRVASFLYSGMKVFKPFLQISFLGWANNDMGWGEGFITLFRHKMFSKLANLNTKFHISRPNFTQVECPLVRPVSCLNCGLRRLQMRQKGLSLRPLS